MKEFHCYFKTTIATLIHACYGRYSSFRIGKCGMQDFTKLYQYRPDARLIAVYSSII